ncbi:MAG: hypothetical protein NTV34_18040 [Proteobacteria bacterium]|nr:hypothetical protein [Pseudomonadota bacterium]
MKVSVLSPAILSILLVLPTLLSAAVKSTAFDDAPVLGEWEGKISEVRVCLSRMSSAPYAGPADGRQIKMNNSLDSEGNLVSSIRFFNTDGTERKGLTYTFESSVKDVITKVTTTYAGDSPKIIENSGPFGSDKYRYSIISNLSFDRFVGELHMPLGNGFNASYLLLTVQNATPNMLAFYKSISQQQVWPHARGSCTFVMTADLNKVN